MYAIIARPCSAGMKTSETMAGELEMAAELKHPARNRRISNATMACLPQATEVPSNKTDPPIVM